MPDQQGRLGFKAVYGISCKSDGSMKPSSGNESAVYENRKRFFSSLGIQEGRIISARTVHGSDAALVSCKDGGRWIENFDALITRDSGIALVVTVADCMPVYFFCPRSASIGIAHAGWQGLLRGILPNTIRQMRTNFEADPESMLVRIGPHLKSCHFEIQDDLESSFAGYSHAMVRRGNRSFLRMATVALKQLSGSGIPAANIQISRDCTYCGDERYFSYRRDKPQVLETMAGYIMLEE